MPYFSCIAASLAFELAAIQTLAVSLNPKIQHNEII